MNKLSLLMVVALSSIAISGCEETIEIIDGKIPANYITAAQPLLGQYSGHMEHKSSVLTLSLNGDKPVLVSSTDLIGTCNSSIGNLLQITVNKSGDNYETSRAVFAFDPGSCKEIMGRLLTLDLYQQDGKTHIQANLLDTIRSNSACYSAPYYPGYGPGWWGYGPGWGYRYGYPYGYPNPYYGGPYGYPGGIQCSSHDTGIYLTGHFIHD